MYSKILYALVLASLMVMPLVTQAQAKFLANSLNDSQTTALGAGYDPIDPRAPRAGLMNAIIAIISLLLGFLGIVVLLIILYAGFLWMTAGGNQDQVAKAKKYMTNGVIGLLIILMSYSLVRYGVHYLIQATTSSPDVGSVL